MIPFNYVVEKTDSKSAPVITPPHKEPRNASLGGIKGEVKLQTMPYVVVVVVFIIVVIVIIISWFHGKINREEAEKLLSPPKNGLFLVRESTAYTGDYTLSVV